MNVRDTCDCNTEFKSFWHYVDHLVDKHGYSKEAAQLLVLALGKSIKLEKAA